MYFRRERDHDQEATPNLPRQGQGTAARPGGEAGGEDRFTLQTKAGKLLLHPDENDTIGLGTVFTCFDDPQAARQLVDCNRFSGKWNFHYFDGWTVETAMDDLSAQLKGVLA